MHGERAARAVPYVGSGSIATQLHSRFFATAAALVLADHGLTAPGIIRAEAQSTFKGSLFLA